MTALPHSLPKFMWFFIRPYRWRCALILGLVVFWALDLSARPYFLKLIINGLAAVNDGQGDAQPVYWAAASYIGMAILVNLSARWFDYICLHLSPDLKSDILRQSFAYVQYHSHRYFQNSHAGSITNKLTELARAVDVILFQIINQFFYRILALVIAACALTLVHPWLATILVGWTIAFFYTSYRLAKKTKNLSHHFSEANTHLFGKIVDTITNMATVRLFARHSFERGYVGAHVAEAIHRDKDLRWAMLKQKAVMATAVNLLNGTFIFTLIHLYQQGAITVGDFALVVTLSFSITDAVWNVANELIMFFENLGRCTQAISLVATPHEIKDRNTARALVVKDGGIEFEGVHFAHHGRRPLFCELTVAIPGGQRVGLVGLSGSGKTTFSQLLARLYEPQQGVIKVDGQSVADVSQESLWEGIAFIPQEPNLFHRSIFENIRYGNLAASAEAVFAAARMAQADEFIRQLPEGYDTIVGERGLNLSGGQRQRIVIARALLKKAPILILDEPTSFLDSVTEAELEESMKSLMGNQTMLVIAHRLSTLRNMDRILVFQGGRVVEDGSHFELIGRNGFYTEMWSRQSQGFLPSNAEPTNSELPPLLSHYAS